MKKLKTPRVEKQLQQEPEIKSQSVYELKLSKFELLHLRDLMGILLPPDGAQTLSKALASLEDRVLIDSMLWNKVSALCIEAKLPVDAAAPDYIIAPVAPPPMGIFQVNQDLQDSGPTSAGFLPSEEEGE